MFFGGNFFNKLLKCAYNWQQKYSCNSFNLYHFISARIRLGGTGSSGKDGFVEGLGTNGIWGGICNHGFDIDDAHVICRMLGYPSATLALTSLTVTNLYGTANSGNNFVLDALGCTGTEESVFDCPHPGEWQENCVASDIAGVHCATSKILQISMNHFYSFCTFYPIGLVRVQV